MQYPAIFNGILSEAGIHAPNINFLKNDENGSGTSIVHAST